MKEFNFQSSYTLLLFTFFFMFQGQRRRHKGGYTLLGKFIAIYVGILLLFELYIVYFSYAVRSANERGNYNETRGGVSSIWRV